MTRLSATVIVGIVSHRFQDWDMVSAEPVRLPDGDYVVQVTLHYMEWQVTIGCIDDATVIVGRLAALIDAV